MQDVRGAYTLKEGQHEGPDHGVRAGKAQGEGPAGEDRESLVQGSRGVVPAPGAEGPG